MKFQMKLIRYHKNPDYAVMELNTDPGEPHDVLKEFEVDVPFDPNSKD